MRHTVERARGREKRGSRGKGERTGKEEENEGRRKSNGRKLSRDWLNFFHKMSAPQTPMSDLWGRFEEQESGEDKGGKRRKESIRTDWGHEETNV